MHENEPEFLISRIVAFGARKTPKWLKPSVFCVKSLQAEWYDYTDAPQWIQELKEKVRAVINEIEPQMCENVMENLIKRVWSCKRSRRDHINDIVFYY